MNIAIRKIGQNKYYYLDHNESVNGTVKKYSTILSDLNESAIVKAIETIKQKVIIENSKNTSKRYKFETLEPKDILRLEEIKFILKLIKANLPDTYESYVNDEFIRFAQGSSSVEGNSISLQDANLILEKGISISGHEVNEVKEIENLGKVRIYLQDRRKMTERTLKKIHSVLMNGFNDKTPGEYRTEPIFITGSPIKTINPKDVKNNMKELFNWYDKNKDKVHPIELTSKIHSWFEKIHPFKDGNGRTGRELLNFILLQNKFPRVIINLKNRENYIKALERSQIKEEYHLFSKFVYDTLDIQFKAYDKLFDENKNLIADKLLKNLKNKKKKRD